MPDDPSKGQPGERGENAQGSTGGAGGAGGTGGVGEESGGPGGTGGTGGIGGEQRMPVEIVGLKDRRMAFGWRVLIFAVLYLGLVFTIAVIATFLTEGPPF